MILARNLWNQMHAVWKVMSQNLDQLHLQKIWSDPIGIAAQAYLAQIRTLHLGLLNILPSCVHPSITLEFPTIFVQP